MTTLRNDLIFALRQLRRSPALALTAILTLALGIGANTAIFSLLDQALLRSLPVREPKQLVVLKQSTLAWNGATSNNGGDDTDYFSYPMYKDLRDRNQVFDGMIGTAPASAGFSRGGSSQVLNVELVTGNYFNVLGVQPSLGRLLSQADDTAPGGNPVAVVSYDFWRTQLASDPNIANSKISLNGHPFQVIGVAAPGFHSAVWGQVPAVFVPMAMEDNVTSYSGKLDEHFKRWMNILGRLKPGITADRAEIGVQPLWHALRADELKLMGGGSKRFVTEFLDNDRLLLKPGAAGFSYRRPTIEKPFLALMAMAALVLAIAAINVASLLLVRSAGRVREFAMRTALGASTGRVLAQLMMEGLVIGVGGGAIGLITAPISLRVLVNQLSDPDSGNPFSASLDLRLVSFNFSIAVLVSVLFSLAPALQLRRLNISRALREAKGTGSNALLNMRRVTVCLQIGLSVILLVGAGLFLRTMQKLRAVDVGFNTTHLVVFDLDPTMAGYSAASVPAIHQRLLTALAGIPAVEAVAATDDPELADNDTYGNVSVSGYVTPPDDSYRVENSSVTPGYFAVMQMPIVAGRALSEQDIEGRPPVTVVNQTFARHFCGTPQACIGRLMALGAGDRLKLTTQIVGVVRDARHGSVRTEASATWFRPVRQVAGATSLTFYLRYQGDSAPVITSARRVLHEAATGLAPTGLRTMEQQVDNNLSNERLISLLAVAFGGLATLLAGVGIYGVLAYSTAQRTREIGIRMALGSSRAAISGVVLGDVLRLASIGILVALPVAFGLSRLLRSQLFNVSPADPLSMLLAVLLIAAVAFLAAAIPALRAASIDPTEALRTE